MAPTASTSERPTNFLSLPGELRNYIYSLSRCLQVYQCAGCTLRANEPLPNLENIYKCSSLCPNCRTYYSSLGPYNAEPPILSFWVNRCSYLAQEGAETSCELGSIKKLRTAKVSCKNHPPKQAWDRGAKHITRISQPELTKVSKQVRDETLSIFYGNRSFLFTLMNTEIDGLTVRKWLRTIGKENAAKLRTLKIVYRTKADRRYVKEDLMREMKKLGVKTDEDVVMVKRLQYPYCYCEHCTRKLLGEM